LEAAQKKRKEKTTGTSNWFTGVRGGRKKEGVFTHSLGSERGKGRGKKEGRRQSESYSSGVKKESQE